MEWCVYLCGVQLGVCVWSSGIKLTQPAGFGSLLTLAPAAEEDERDSNFLPSRENSAQHHLLLLFGFLDLS